MLSFLTHSGSVFMRWEFEATDGYFYTVECEGVKFADESVSYRMNIDNCFGGSAGRLILRSVSLI